MTGNTFNATKRAVRTMIWDDLERTGAVAPGVHGRIPAFDGAVQAAHRLADLEVWRRSQVLKAVPDTAQRPVRALALDAGKLLYMAVPRLEAPEPFYRLDPTTLTVPPETVAHSREAARHGEHVDVHALLPVDLVITGSVVVNSEGVRLGKGAGYFDIEVAILAEAGLIRDQTVIVTTVHDLQVVDDVLPDERHDTHVDVIVTPTRVIHCTDPQRPEGIDWSHVPAAMIEQIPALARRYHAAQEPGRPESSG